MEPLVTIGIPNYNSGIFLKEACESILNQTYTKFEVIVTDDNSSDDSFTLAQEISDSRFTFIPGKKNRGPQAQRNEQLERANGKYFCVFDADDTWHPDKIQRQVEFMEQNANVFAIGTALNVGVIPFEPTNPVFEKSERDEVLKTQLFWETPIWNNSLIFRVQIARSYGLKYIEGEWAEDQTFLLAAAKANLEFSNLKENLTFYRSHEGQMTAMSERLIQSAYKLRMKHGVNYFPNFEEREWKLLLLNQADLRGRYSAKDYLEKIHLFRRLRQYCKQDDCTFPQNAELAKRCDITIYTLILEGDLNIKFKTLALLRNYDVVSRLIVQKLLGRIWFWN